MPGKKHPGKQRFTVGVETSPAGADVWRDGCPYRLHAVVVAVDLGSAIEQWRRTYGFEPNICLSLNPAHADVVELRRKHRERLPS